MTTSKKCVQCDREASINAQCTYHYHKQYRESSLQRRDRCCTQCTSSSSIKWYAGPVCRKCYRNSDDIKIKDKIRYTKNIYKILEQQKKYKNKIFIDKPETKIAKNLRSRLYNAIRNSQKMGSAVKDLGCSIEDFKKHLESLWQPGMSWCNYGLRGWHIDHVIPISSFDLVIKQEQLKACHYTNLQPLWAKDNLSKGDRYEKKR